MEDQLLDSAGKVREEMDRGLVVGAPGWVAWVLENALAGV
jgi:hypothetical protein